MNGEQYFEPRPSSPSKARRVTVRLWGRDLELWTDRGVFAKSGLDLGTSVLFRKAPPPPSKGDILDLGCGYGPISMWVALHSPESTVWAVDVNERALELTRRNADEWSLDNIRAVKPDEVPPGLRFDAIYSNPPVHIGKRGLHDLLATWLTRLEPEARAFLVIQKNLGADSLQEWLSDQFPTKRLGSSKGFRVFEVRSRRS